MTSTTSQTLRGRVSRIFFSSAESQFLAGIMRMEDGKEVRISGKLYADEGDSIEVTGKHGRHPKYGDQFEVESGMVRSIDESPAALAHLMASSAEFEGLGPVRARKVVDAALALSVDGDFAAALLEYPGEIADRVGLAKSVVEQAGEVWNSRRENFNALAALVGMGWTTAQARKIVNEYGSNAAAVIGEDYYVLVGKIERFGFRTVDAVALKNGVRKSDTRRLISGISYVIRSVADGGHTWITRESLVAESLKELRPDTLDGEDRIDNLVDMLLESGAISAFDLPGKGAQTIRVLGDRYITGSELASFRDLLYRLTAPRGPESQIDVHAAEGVFDTLTDGQANAVRAAFGYGCSLISGGAGVGKTYLIKAIAQIAEANGLEVELAAPTGKAARRMREATGRGAQTIHRLLETKFEEGRWQFTRNAKNPLDAQVVVIDEVSMVDVRLMGDLLAALPDHAILVLVGDHNQIPSVGPGAILRDLLASQNEFESVNILTEVMRQAGVLALNTTAILDGVVVRSTSPEWTVHSVERGGEDGAVGHITDLVTFLTTQPPGTHIAPFDAPLDPAWDIQVLAPMRKGPMGTYAINARLQALRQNLLGNPPPMPAQPDRKPKPLKGDRVIWTKNDYELNLFNGTQAIVEAVTKGGGYKLLIDDGRMVKLPPRSATTSRSLTL